MWGEPEDEPGECNARLYIADNYGDGTATMRCRLDPGHDGDHQETFTRKHQIDGKTVEGTVTVTWQIDESMVCSVCSKRRERDGCVGDVCWRCRHKQEKEVEPAVIDTVPPHLAHLMDVPACDDCPIGGRDVGQDDPSKFCKRAPLCDWEAHREMSVYAKDLPGEVGEE